MLAPPRAQLALRVWSNGSNTAGREPRAAYVVRHALEPPLTTDELGGTEAAFNKAKQTVIKGKWELFSTTQVAEQAYGPRRLTSDEYLEAIREEIALRALARLFTPILIFSPV